MLVVANSRYMGAQRLKTGDQIGNWKSAIPSLVLRPSISKLDEFVQRQVAISPVFQTLDVGGAHTMILEPHQLFNRNAVVADILQFFNERCTDAVVFHRRSVSRSSLV